MTVPYLRHSTRSAHWFIGQALEGWSTLPGLTQGGDRRPTVSSFSLSPDTAVGRHPAPRTFAALARPRPDRRRVGCDVRCAAPRARCRPATPTWSPASAPTPTMSTRSARRSASFSSFARDASYPYGSGGPNSIFALITANYMSTSARRARTSAASRRPANQCAGDPECDVQEAETLDDYMAARPISDPIHLFDCVMPAPVRKRSW